MGKRGSTRSRGAGEKEDAGTRGRADAGAAGHTDLRTGISRVRGKLEPRVLVLASSPLRVSPEGTLRTWSTWSTFAPPYRNLQPSTR